MEMFKPYLTRKQMALQYQKTSWRAPCSLHFLIVFREKGMHESNSIQKLHWSWHFDFLLNPSYNGSLKFPVYITETILNLQKL